MCPSPCSPLQCEWGVLRELYWYRRNLRFLVEPQGTVLTQKWSKCKIDLGNISALLWALVSSSVCKECVPLCSSALVGQKNANYNNSKIPFSPSRQTKLFKKWFLMLEGNWYICALLVGIWIATVLGEKSVAVSSNEKHACHQQSGERAPLGVEYRPKPYIVWAPQVLVVFYFLSGSGHTMLYWWEFIYEQLYTYGTLSGMLYSDKVLYACPLIQ